MYLKIYAGIIIPLYWTDINLRYMYKNSLLIWLTCISDLQFHILIKYRRLKSTPPPLYKEKQNITFIPYIFVLWNYTWTVAYCGQSMQKTSDRRTWPMCSASGPMNHFLHQTRMSNVSVSGFELYNFYFYPPIFFIAASCSLFFLNPNFNKLSSLLIVIFRHALTVLSKSQGHFIQLLTHKFISTKIILTESLVKKTWTLIPIR